MVFQVRYYREEKQRPVCLFDVEVYLTKDDSDKDYYVELHSTTCVNGIVNYVFDYLNDADEETRIKFLEDATRIEEMRGWLWEVYKPSHDEKTYSEQKKEVIDAVRTALQDFCDKMPGELFVNED